jgi:multicomponent Na+:H+ antiporter subunit D
MSPLVTLLPPLLVIPFIIFFGERRRNLRELCIFIASGSLFALNLMLLQQFNQGQALASSSIILFDVLTLSLSVEPLGLLFGLLASFLWIVTTLYSVGYMRGHNEKNQTRFYVCFAIAIASVMAAAYAENLLTLFVAYEAITLSTFPLVTHAGTEKAKRAGRIYLGILMVGSILLLMPAMIVIWWLTGSLDFVSGGVFQGVEISPVWVCVLLMLIVFGTGKAAVMPFHAWLPNAMVAPTPVSALLHAVAVVKTGVFFILKVVVYIFGFEIINETGANTILMVVAATTILLSSLIAMRKDNLKERLAYSTISQLSYIVLAALIANAYAMQGAALHILSHAFGKITLFFCAGAIMVACHKTAISQLDGLGKKMPYTMTAFFIAALSIIGLPPLAGMWSKLVISQGAIDAGLFWLVVVLMISSLLNIAYLLPIPLRAFFKKSTSATTTASTAATDSAGIQEAPMACLIAIAITTLGCIVIFFQIDFFSELISRVKVG